MAERTQPPSTEGLLNEILARLRAVERQRFVQEVNETTEAGAGTDTPAYSWQSPFTLVTGAGHKLYADRNGMIKFCRAERSAADGTSTATLNVYKNGTSIFTSATKPTVPASTGLGPERTPDTRSFEKGDYFYVDVEATGGGNGPLRLTISFTTS